MKAWQLRWVVLISANVLFCCMLGFQQSSGAPPSGGQLPFSNAVEQRHEMIRELKQISALLREQNALLRQRVPHDPSESNPRR